MYGRLPRYVEVGGDDVAPSSSRAAGPRSTWAPVDPLELSCNLTIAGEDAASDHVVRRVGPDAISITSASAAAETELRSIYIGAGKNPQVLVAERSTVGSQPALLASRWMDAAEGVVNYAPAQCLYDNLQHVQDLAEENVGSPDGVSGLERAEASSASGPHYLAQPARPIEGAWLAGG